MHGWSLTSRIITRIRYIPYVAPVTELCEATDLAVCAAADVSALGVPASRESCAAVGAACTYTAAVCECEPCHSRNAAGTPSYIITPPLTISIHFSLIMDYS
eukprot:COSAG05_NODE_1648_length_4340_cov_79.370667_7_plen_102_part_00